MLILGMDTSSSHLSVALDRDKEIIYEISKNLEKQHSSMLVPIIRAALEAARFRLEDIDGFIIGIGPGSFTGLRIGIATVKGFGLATGRPCVGVPSIDAIVNFLAHSPMSSDLNKKWLIPIIDAKRNQVYSSLYKFKDGGIKRYLGYLLLPVEKLLKRFKGSAVFLGNGVKIFKGSFSSFKKDAEFLPEDFWYPRASQLIELGRRKLKKYKEGDLNRLLPLYIYPKECQVK